MTKDGLEMKLVEKDMPEPKPHEIVVQVEATPINPSDHGVMFGWADISKATSTGTGANRVLRAPLGEAPPSATAEAAAVGAEVGAQAGELDISR